MACCVNLGARVHAGQLYPVTKSAGRKSARGRLSANAERVGVRQSNWHDLCLIGSGRSLRHSLRRRLARRYLPAPPGPP
jgi:hypothetical protein